MVGGCQAKSDGFGGGARERVDSGGVIGVVEFPTFGGNRWLVLIKEGRFLNRPLRNSGFPSRSLLDLKLQLLGK